MEAITSIYARKRSTVAARVIFVLRLAPCQARQKSSIYWNTRIASGSLAREPLGCLEEARPLRQGDNAVCVYPESVLGVRH